MSDAPPEDGASAEVLESAALPEIPDSLGVEPLLSALLHCAAFLDLSPEDVVAPGPATDVLEHVGLYVQRLPLERQAELAEQLERLKAYAEQEDWPEPLIEFIDEFLYSCGIGEDEED